MEEIDIMELLSFVKDKIGMVISITAVVCILGCIYGLFLQTPMFRSYTTVILNSNETTSITQTDITLNKNLVDTYTEVVKSRKVLVKVIDELDLDLTYEQLSSKITVTDVNDTQIIKISVTDKDSNKAKDIANSTAKYFSDIIKDLYNMNNVDILDEAIETNTPYNINVLKQVVTYFAIGLVIALGVVFLIYYFDRTIKSVEQVEQKVKLPILGSVQDMDRGVKRK